MTTFERCLVQILSHEGGFVDHPKDPGGATNMGITHRTLSAWRGHPVTKDDVRLMDREEAAAIYRANYWRPLGCDNLPAGVALHVFDFGVNAGVSRSAKLIQRIAGVEADGKVGPKTIAAIGKLDPAMVIAQFTAGRMDHYRALSTWSTFGKGWTRRTLETEAAALAMHAPVQSPKPVPRPSLWARIVSAFTR